MQRVIKEHHVRRNEILETSLALIYTKGYEQMTIQDILDSLHISKGAFYHYFDSKHNLLEALIERIAHQAEQILIPVVHDPDLSAIEKLQRFFETAANWKATQKTFILALLKVWYTDDNAIVRQKVNASSIKQFRPLLMTMIQQGIDEGVLKTAFPDYIGEVVMSIMLGLGDSLSSFLFQSEQNAGTLDKVEGIVVAYNDALEKVLGASPGALSLIDPGLFKDWIIAPGDKPQRTIN